MRRNFASASAKAITDWCSLQWLTCSRWVRTALKETLSLRLRHALLAALTVFSFGNLQASWADKWAAARLDLIEVSPGCLTLRVSDYRLDLHVMQFDRRVSQLGIADGTLYLNVRHFPWRHNKKCGLPDFYATRTDVSGRYDDQSAIQLTGTFGECASERCLETLPDLLKLSVQVEADRLTIIDAESLLMVDHFVRERSVTERLKHVRPFVQKIYSMLDNGDYASLYTLFTDARRREVSREVFVETVSSQRDRLSISKRRKFERTYLARSLSGSSPGWLLIHAVTNDRGDEGVEVLAIAEHGSTWRVEAFFYI